ncbi:MAG: tRNA (adenosine(37)-N6)-threonylcarbamoyltransferase complex dimerization subunit type 1 TsaB [Betaproteobacteria bacterium]|nr:tRNA (adenosine(37)-N6)-threonylcarbamoyltransferase complex dimerization subunit type 1 TsaB [Betaproteobacteria bacterium]
MRILALDTSTEWCSVAVGVAGAWLERSEHVGQAHSERLLPMVDAALAAAQWAPVDLDAIAFGCGPGSFTGIRIGCAVAQGLAFALDRPLLGVPTLEAIAVADGSDDVLCCLDARMREVYVAAYRRIEGRLTEVAAPAVLPPARVRLPEGMPAARRWTGAGPGFAAYADLAPRLGLARVHAAALPTATAIATLASPRLLAGEGVPAAAALPLYVRHHVALTTAERAAGAVLS